ARPLAPVPPRPSPPSARPRPPRRPALPPASALAPPPPPRLRQVAPPPPPLGRGLPRGADRPAPAAVPRRPVSHRPARELGRTGRRRLGRQEDQGGRQAPAGDARPAGQALRGQAAGRLPAGGGPGGRLGCRPRR